MTEWNETAQTPEQCLGELLKQPCEETKDAFFQALTALDNKRRTVSVQRRLRRMAERLLWGYTDSGDGQLKAAYEALDVTFDGKLAEDGLMTVTKRYLRHPNAVRKQAVGLFLTKCSDPEAAKSQVKPRMWSRVKKKLGKWPRAISRQVWYHRCGYTQATLTAWERLERRDSQVHGDADPATLRWAHDHGFLYDRVAQWGLTEGNYAQFVSDRDYIFLSPFNNSYRKWIEDLPSMRVCLDGVRHLLPESYYEIISRDGEQLLVRMADLPAGYDSENADDVLRLLREKGSLTLRPSTRSMDALYFILRYENGAYSCLEQHPFQTERLRSLTTVSDYFAAFDAESRGSDWYPMTEAELHWLLKSRGRYYVIQQTLQSLPGTPAQLRAVILNPQVHQPKLLLLHGADAAGQIMAIDPQTGAWDGGQLPDWAAARAQLMEFCAFVPQLEYYAVNFVLTAQGLKVTGCDMTPARLECDPFCPELNDFLLEKVRKAKGRKHRVFTLARLKKLRWKVFKKLFCRKGYQEFFLHEYVTSVIHDLLHFHGTTLKQKIWCYRRGFYSYHLAQYDLTEENWQDYVSDRDYHWLSPINNRYFKWIDDKTTYRYAMEPCKAWVPEYYYHLIYRNGQPYVIRMQDCPAGYSADMEGVLQLIRDKGKLACKQSSGTHGDGFFKLSWENGEYCINNEPASAEAIQELLSGFSCFYNLTEYLSMHEELCSIYDGSVNTIRVMVLNRDGRNPEMVNAYMRIGAKSTGLTDNVGYGGVFCRVDVDTGRFHDAEQSRDHVIVPCPNHPDTGTLIEGYLPLWDEVKQVVREMCLTVPQLEYLGFDVAITDKGVQVLEINKHQDLHRCPEYGPYIQDFFKHKIELKRKRYHIDA